MTQLQSPVDVGMEILRDLEEFNRSGSNEAFRKQLCEDFVRRSGAASLGEAVTAVLVSLVPFCETTTPSRKRGARPPKPRKPDQLRLPLAKRRLP
jgi:hypothetical protein